jgi:glycosyltransferase involved in cell wall biosynthesis
MKESPLILHDAFSFPGGGEKVAMILARAFHAMLWTGHLDKTPFPESYFGNLQPLSLQAYDTAPSWLKKTKIGQMWYGFSHLSSPNPRWTIFSGSLSLLAHKQIAGPKVLYCHTPPRLLYDQRDFYIGQTPFINRPAMMGLIYFYKRVYEEAFRAMDLIIANSENVQKRIKQYLSLDSVVVYPPCDTTGFRWLGQEDYYLSTARPDLLKRVDVIVEAFLKMPDKKLVVVSGGSELERIRNMAQNAQNINILGWVDGERLAQLTGKCIATIYIPKDEDFGMSPVESMAAGKPVIGVSEGGMLETVKDGETGILIKPFSEPEDVIQAVRQMTQERAKGMRRDCETRALGFGTEVFVEKMNKIMLPFNASGAGSV